MTLSSKKKESKSEKECYEKKLSDLQIVAELVTNYYHILKTSLDFDLNTILFLSCLIKLSRYSNNSGGWIQILAPEIYDEIELPRNKQQECRDTLMKWGILEKKSLGTKPSQKYFRVNFEVLIKRIGMI